MKFRVGHCVDWRNFDESVLKTFEFDSLDEIMEFIEESGYGVIVWSPGQLKDEKMWGLEIYSGYRE